MATRIDKKVSRNLDIANNLSALQSFLLRRAGRRLNDINYIGLLRNNALSDLEDPGEALTNVLEYITRIDDANEISTYGTYKLEDFEITRDFVQNEITKNFLTPLKEISIAGGLAGAIVSTTPRIRVEDRIDQINSFTGKGTLNGLHAGPTAVFYRTKPGTDQEFGKIRFGSFNENTGIIGMEAGEFIFKDQKTFEDFTAQTTYNPDDIVLTLKAYINPATNEEISLVGTGITIKGTVVNSYIENEKTIYNRQFQTTDANSLTKLKKLQEIIGSEFINILYIFSREFSILNPPQWFLESPNDSSNNVSYSADDIDPATTHSLLDFRNGVFRLYSEKEYFNSGAYVETRIPVEDRGVYSGNNITKDSNMRFSKPPRLLRDNSDNWGVRWDGYLRIDNDGIDKKYIFEIETNTAIKVDIVNAGSNETPEWNEVFNSFSKEGNAKFIREGDRYISKTSFTLDNLPSRFIYNLSESTGYRYVPISIRMWNGGQDEAYKNLEIPVEPNIFIKYAQSLVNPNIPDTFYSGEIMIEITEEGEYVIVNPDSESEIDLKEILLDTSALVTYQLVTREEEITRVIGEDQNGTPIEETVIITVPLSTPQTITLSSVSNVIYAEALPSTGSGFYTLQLIPNRDDYSQSTLWSSRIVSPKDEYNGYADLLDVNFEPSIYKYQFDARPSWWKVSEGNRYLYGETISKTNDPLDGFVNNSFKSLLQSNAPGVGLYGDGEVEPTYTSRPNLILGEAAYSGDIESSNYIGMRLTPNLLGEGGVVKFTGLPLNNATFQSSEVLGENDLGGSPNHETIAASKVQEQTIPMFFDDNTKRFYRWNTSQLASNETSDNPSIYGLPSFSSNADWNKPIVINAVQASDDPAFVNQTFPAPPVPPSPGGYETFSFVAPLVMNVERVKYNTSTDTFVNNQDELGDNEIWLLGFSTTFEPAWTELNGFYVKFFREQDIAFQFAKVDTGESISFSDTLKITYEDNTFISSASEVPKVPSERVTPFGYDIPSSYTNGICYPPYVISDVLLKEIAKSDEDLYDINNPIGNYDVIWGDHTRQGLGGNKLNIAEKIEFSYSLTDNPANIISPLNPVKELRESDYTHRIKVEFPIFNSNGELFDEDVYQHIGNQEKVKDTYYLFVNARQNPLVSNSALLSGIG